MRKLVCLLCTVALLLAPCSGALAAGVTLRAFTPFADADFAAQAYMDIVTAWEAQTGNIVEDYSAQPDETWLSQLMELAAGGEADIVVAPAGSGLTYEQLATAQELAEAAPELGVRVLPEMAEPDGSVLLTPVRSGWEALYVNRDVLAAAGLSVPSSYEELIAVCAALAQQGVTPIANALCEWAEATLDCAALMCAPAESFGQEASLSGAQTALAALTAVGAFGQDPWNASDTDMEAQFLSGQAAMRFDYDALATLVPAGRCDEVTVVRITPDGSDAVPGSPGFGLALTRACFDDPARREAAISLAAALLGGADAASLVTPARGELGRSIAALTASSTCAGTLYDLNPTGFDAWQEQTVAALMAL